MRLQSLSARSNNMTRTRRSQRILSLNSIKSAGKQQVYDLDSTSSEIEVVDLLEPVVSQLHTSENVDAQSNNCVSGLRVKGTRTTINNPLEMNNGVAAAAPTELLKQVNDAGTTQQVLNNAKCLDDDVVPVEVDIAGKNHEQDVEKSASQKISYTNARYKTLYRKAMRRLEAVTEERNMLSRQLAVAETKIGVLNDFRDQLSEVNKQLDIANERLEVYQKTMNPQMEDMLRELLATLTTRSQGSAVPRNISSSKDAASDKVTKPVPGISKNRKRRANN